MVSHLGGGPRVPAGPAPTLAVVSDTRITVRLSGAQVAALDDLCADQGISRSLALRRLLDGAGGAGAVTPGRLDRDDLLDLLHERARAGSAPAIRLLLEREEGAVELERLRALTTDSRSTEEVAR